MAMENETTRTDVHALKEVRVRLKLTAGENLYSDSPITDSERAVRIMHEAMKDLDRERLCAVNLDEKGRPLNYNIVSIGTVNRSIAMPAEIYKSAILSNASSVILLHNHPSGDPTPSRPDVVLTQRFAAVGKLMGIQVVDHIIVGGDRTFSFFEQMPEVLKEADNSDIQLISTAAETASVYGVEERSVERFGHGAVTPFMVHISNPQTYEQTGEAKGRWLELPISAIRLADAADALGIHDGTYFIDQVQSHVPGLQGSLEEFDDIDELNYMAGIVKGMNTEQYAAMVNTMMDREDLPAIECINMALGLCSKPLYNGDKETIPKTYRVAEAPWKETTQEETRVTKLQAQPVDHTFDYQLLNRLQQDCEYYISTDGAGRLWGVNTEDHLAKMRELYDRVPVKPEWLTPEQIDRYGSTMEAIDTRREEWMEQLNAGQESEELKEEEPRTPQRDDGEER